MGQVTREVRRPLGKGVLGVQSRGGESDLVGGRGLGDASCEGIRVFAQTRTCNAKRLFEPCACGIRMPCKRHMRRINGIGELRTDALGMSIERIGHAGYAVVDMCSKRRGKLTKALCRGRHDIREMPARFLVMLVERVASLRGRRVECLSQPIAARRDDLIRLSKMTREQFLDMRRSLAKRIREAVAARRHQMLRRRRHGA